MGLLGRLAWNCRIHSKSRELMASMSAPDIIRASGDALPTRLNLNIFHILQEDLNGLRRFGMLTAGKLSRARSNPDGWDIGPPIKKSCPCNQRFVQASVTTSHATVSCEYNRQVGSLVPARALLHCALAPVMLLMVVDQEEATALSPTQRSRESRFDTNDDDIEHS